MKKYLIPLLSFLLFALVSCGSQPTIDSASLQNMMQNDEFTFVAERANPTNYDVVNVIGSMPNGNTARVLNLDSGYDIVLRKGEMEVTLPYFGRAFSTTMDPRDQSFRFNSKDFTLNKTQNKKGNWVYEIHPKDHNKVRTIYIEVFKSGRTYTSIDANDRQPISYDGRIEKNVPSTK